MVAGSKESTSICDFSGYAPSVTETPSPTWRFMPMGPSLPSPVTQPTSRPFASASYSTWRTKLSSHSGPSSSMALHTGMNADSFLRVMSTTVNPASSSCTMGSHSLPHRADCWPFWLISISTTPPVGRNWMCDSSGWLVCSSSNTAFMMVLGIARSALTSACLTSAAFMHSANFW